jgi:hypothetical protein
MNWWYVGSVLAVTAAAVVFVAWFATAPVFSAASAGKPLPEGWSVVSAAVFDGFLVSYLLYLGWVARQCARTEIDEAGISQPSLLGPRRIHWSDVRRVSRSGYGLHIHGERCRIVVTPYAYKDPSAVVRAVVGHVPTRARQLA